eukprot:gene34871-49582_t
MRSCYGCLCEPVLRRALGPGVTSRQEADMIKSAVPICMCIVPLFWYWNIRRWLKSWMELTMVTMTLTILLCDWGNGAQGNVEAWGLGIIAMD